MSDRRQYNRLTVRAAVELAAPHTWPASVLPVVLGTALSLALARSFHPGVLLSTLCAAVLLQCAVNTLNDYADFVKGTDTPENSDDPTDAALIYHGVRPRSALLLGGAFLLLAAACGAYTVVKAGWIPLAIGVVGGAVVLLYSLGRLPISYLPLGELCSGVVMGGLIPLACFAAQTGTFSWEILWYALPAMLTIGLIMLTNNTCDIERDRPAGRRTLPVLLGRGWSARLLKLLLAVSLALVGHIVFWSFRGGFFLFPVAVFAALLPLSRLLASPVDAGARGASMGATLKTMVTINGFYCIMIVVHLLRDVL